MKNGKDRSLQHILREFRWACWPTKGDEDPGDDTIRSRVSEGIQNPESECGMARSALLLLNSGSWILNSPIRYGVFNGVGVPHVSSASPLLRAASALPRTPDKPEALSHPCYEIWRRRRRTSIANEISPIGRSRLGSGVGWITPNNPWSSTSPGPGIPAVK